MRRRWVGRRQLLLQHTVHNGVCEVVAAAELQALQHSV